MTGSFCSSIINTKLLILFCILAVFAPAFTMSGIPGSLFLPLALAIAFSMITSYLLSQTFVPIMANWIMKNKHAVRPASDFLTPDRAKHEAEEKHQMAERIDADGDGKISLFERFRARYMRFVNRMMPYKKIIVSLYVIGAIGGAALMLATTGRDVLPRVNSGQFQLRMRAPDGTRIERTEQKMVQAIAELGKLVGPENIGITSAYVGAHPALFSVSPIYLFSSGPHEAICLFLHASSLSSYISSLGKSASWIFWRRTSDAFPST
ncbi:MAG: efflux RND transporter permease subunit [Pedobacter sp.]|nr:MAG: efflux RND transporter permease subunit [Pedobacter sp.]